MFPCFEISQKDDLFQVMVYLATENQLCPDPTPKSEEETIHQEIDSLMGLGLIFCYKQTSKYKLVNFSVFIFFQTQTLERQASFNFGPFGKIAEKEPHWAYPETSSKAG